MMYINRFTIVLLIIISYHISANRPIRLIRSRKLSRSRRFQQHNYQQPDIQTYQHQHQHQHQQLAKQSNHFQPQQSNQFQSQPIQKQIKLIQPLVGLTYKQQDYKLHHINIDLRNLNRLERRLKKKKGDFKVSLQQARDVGTACSLNEEQQRVGQQMLDQVIEYMERPNSMIKDEYTNIYYVSASGIKSEYDCRLDNNQAGFLFMVMNKDYPYDINFNNPNRKILFLRVCYNQDPYKIYSLKFCPFDECSETSQKQDLEFLETSWKRGNCMRDIDPDEPISVQLTNQGPTYLSYEQVQPFGLIQNRENIR